MSEKNSSNINISNDNKEEIIDVFIFKMHHLNFFTLLVVASSLIRKGV